MLIIDGAAMYDLKKSWGGHAINFVNLLEFLGSELELRSEDLNGHIFLTYAKSITTVQKFTKFLHYIGIESVVFPVDIVNLKVFDTIEFYRRFDVQIVDLINRQPVGTPIILFSDSFQLYSIFNNLKAPKENTYDITLVHDLNYLDHRWSKYILNQEIKFVDLAKVKSYITKGISEEECGIK